MKALTAEWVKKAEGDAKSKTINADADARVTRVTGDAEAAKVFPQRRLHGRTCRRIGITLRGVASAERAGLRKRMNRDISPKTAAGQRA